MIDKETKTQEQNQMTTLSAVIKKELKQAFPGIKFSVTTKRDDVRVEWEMTLGTAATKQAVKEICKRHETVKHHGNLMDDTAWSSGISIYCYPSYTQEREDCAVAGVIDYKFADATWDAKYERFMRANGEEHYHATKLYYSYRDNGVASGLVDEWGNEPSCKRWYYEKLNPPAATPESEQVEQIEPEEVQIVPLAIYQVENEVYIQANFPTLNKQDWIDGYRSQATNLCQAKITEVVHLSPENYQIFIYSFLNDQPWLAGKGGSSSHYVSEKYGNDYDKLFCDELEAKKWRRECYEISILVTDGRHYVLVNPKGHNYARYVGLEYLATLGWVLEKCNIQLTANPAEPVTINQQKTQSEQPQPEVKPELLAIDSLVVTEKYRIKVTDVRTETVTGQLLDDRDNLILEYGHPVYVCIRKSEILSSSEQQPEPETTAPTAPETNLIPFPSPKQPEPQYVAQPQSDGTDSFYSQSYQAWVNKLVARGEYAKIKSFEEWYAIAVEVM